MTILARAVLLPPSHYAKNLSVKRGMTLDRHKKEPRAGYAVGVGQSLLPQSVRLLGRAAGVSGDGVPPAPA
jgi:hypothetical protein